MDWQRFAFDYRADLGELRTKLIQIEASKEAASQLVLPPDWRAQLDRLNRVRAIHGTTAIEGNPLSEAEVDQRMEQLAEHADPDSLSREHRQILNAGRAQDWIKERFAPGRPPVEYADIMRMHYLMTLHSDETANTPGRLRQHSVVVGTEALGGVHRGAPAPDLQRLMHEFVAFLNGRRLKAEHPVVQALAAHFFLVTLHPFGDGNGRTSRLLEAGILFQGGYNVLGFYGLSNYFYRNSDEYKLLLQRSRRAQPFDLTAFVAFGIEGFAAELKGINNFIKAKLNRLVYRDTLVRSYNTRTGPRRRLLNQREHGLLDYLLVVTEPTDPFADAPSRRIAYEDLLADPFVRSAYRTVTERTFQRELTRLADTGFVKLGVGDGGTTVEIDFDAIGKY